VNGAMMSLDKLNEWMRVKLSRANPRQESAFFIQPSKDVAFSNAWPVVVRAARLGQWRQTIVAEKLEVSFSIPSREGERLSPVVLKGFKGDTMPPGMDVVRVTADGMFLNDTAGTVADITTHFSAKREKAESILIVASGNAPMGEVFHMLHSIRSAGNSNLCLAAEERLAQEFR